MKNIFLQFLFLLILNFVSIEIISQSFVTTVSRINTNVQSNSMAASKVGTIYLSGNVNDSIFFAEIDTLGNVLWFKSINIGVGNEQVTDMIVSNDSMILACGNFNIGSSTVYSFIIKFNPFDQTVLWVRTNTVYIVASVILQNPIDSNVIFFGEQVMGFGQNRGVYHQFNYATGAQVSNRRYRITSTESTIGGLIHNNIIYGVGRDQGAGGGSGQFRPGFHKMDLSGLPINTKHLIYPLNIGAQTYAYSVGLTNNDSLIIATAGFFLTTTFEVGLTKVDTNGNIGWAKRYPINGSNQEIVSEVYPLNDGYILIGNMQSQNLGIFIFKVDLSGNLLWGKRVRRLPGGVLVRFPATKNIVELNNHVYINFSYNLGVANSFRSVVASIDSLGNINLPCDLTIDSLQVSEVSIVNPVTTNFNYFVENNVVSTTQQIISAQNTGFLTIKRVNDPNTISIPDTTICPNDSFLIVLDSNLGTYQWSDNSTNPSFWVNDTGIYSVTLTDAFNCDYADTFYVSYNSLTALGLTGDTFICSYDSALMQVNTGFANYQWSNGSMQASQHVNVSGMYSVTVVDSNGCVQSDSIALFVANAKVLALIPDTILCYDTLAINAGSGFATYQWSNSSVDSLIWVNTSGLYSLTVIDSLGCTDSGQVQVTIHPQIVLDPISDTLFCEDDTITKSTNLGFVSYVWNSGQLTSSLLVSETGYYSVTVSDTNACEDSTSFNAIMVQRFPPYLGSDTIMCKGESYTLSPAGTYVSYLWHSGDTSSSLLAVADSSYWVETIDSNGCVSSDTIQISMYPEIQISLSDTTICSQDSIPLSVGLGFVSYLWNTGAVSSNITVLNGGLYSVTVTDTANCVDSAQMQLSLHTLPVLVLDNDTTFCESDTIVRGTQQLFNTYVWNTGDTTPHISITAGGTYRLTISDSNTCFDSALVQVTEVLRFPPYLGPDTVICETESYALSPVGVFTSFLWSTSDTTNSITAQSNTSYWVETIDTNGCVSSDTIHITSFNPTLLHIGNDTTICVGSVIAFQAGPGFVSYQWSPNGQTSIGIPVSLANTYSVTAIDTNGCAFSDTATLSLYPMILPNWPGYTRICEGDTAFFSLNPILGTYIWNNSDTGNSYFTDQERTVNVQLIDTNGCLRTSNFNVDTVQFYTPVLGSDTVICSTDSVLIGDTIPVPVGWNTLDSVPFIHVKHGTFILTATTQGVCHRSDTIVVDTVNPALVNLGGDRVLCPGDTVEIGINPNQSNLTVSWSNGFMGSTQLITATTDTISVTLSNGVCTVSDTARFLFLNTQLIMPKDTVLCGVNTFTINPTTSPGVNFRWSNGTQNPQLTVTQTNQYKVTVSYNNLCPLSDSIQVSFFSVPTFTLGADVVRCEGDTVQIQVPNNLGVILWSNGSSQPSQQFTSSQTVWAQIVNSGGCKHSDTIDLRFFKPKQVQLGNDVVTCEKQWTIGVLNQPFLNYLWNNNLRNPEQTVNTGGTYSITTIDSNNCLSSDSIRIRFEPTPEINMIPYHELCEGDTLNWGGPYVSNYIHEWNTGDRSVRPVFTESGMYSVTVTNPGGNCRNTGMVQIDVTPRIKAVVPEDTVLCREKPFFVLPSSPTMQSMYENQFIRQLEIEREGQYCFSFENRCFKERECTFIYVEQCDCPLFVPTAFSPNSDGKNEFFFPVYDCEMEEFVFEVFNRWGERVFVGNDGDVGWNGLYQGQLCQPTVYVWKLSYVPKTGRNRERVERYGTVLLKR